MALAAVAANPGGHGAPSVLSIPAIPHMMSCPCRMLARHRVGTWWRLRGIASHIRSGHTASQGPPQRPRIDMARALNEPPRSEEHTSELQSHHDLVCRLL